MIHKNRPCPQGDRVRSLSVVIPVHNEEENLRPLYDALMEVLPFLSMDYEIIFIDDGSTDRSLEVIREFNEVDSRVRCVILRCNAGQTAATLVGFNHASGEVVITMDGDLQHHPRDIPRVLLELEKGYDMVSTWRFDRSKERFGKRVPSKLSNMLARFLTGLKIHDYGSGFKAYRREVLEGLCLYGSFHRYVAAIVFHNGYVVSEVKIEYRQRLGGKTKYGVDRLVEGLRDLVYITLASRFKRNAPAHLLASIMERCCYPDRERPYEVAELVGFDRDFKQTADLIR